MLNVINYSTYITVEKKSFAAAFPREFLQRVWELN